MQDAEDNVLSVSELTLLIKGLLEDTFTEVWVAGEISNFSRPQSGHCYLTLKDDAAQIRGVIWRTTAARVQFDLHDGLEVVCRGRMDVYPPRGGYQLVIDRIEPRGIGALELALRQLRARLAAEGLFEPARKRPLPRFPRRIAVVTSPTGAAIRDFLEVLRRRWRGVDVLIVPCRVQGDGAGAELAAAVRTVGTLRPAVDVCVVTRGGGSLEDLWAFNEEVLVRAIYDSPVPVISAVGHEIDVSLSDLVADVRALTPSEAAERIAPAADELKQLLAATAERLSAGLKRRASQSRNRLESLAAHQVFRRPLDRIHQAGRRLDELQARLTRATEHRVSRCRSRAEHLAGQLESLSPLGVLGRGYSLTQSAEGRVVRRCKDVQPGDLLQTRLVDGNVLSEVREIRPISSESSHSATDLATEQHEME